ncbi:MAG: endonuclease I [Myxococcales bacterium]|nr:endonuclease I [Myxococcales bacterium]
MSREQREATRKRIVGSREERERVRARLRSGHLPSEIDDASVVDKRFRRLGIEELRRDVRRLERVLGTSNLVPAATLERGAKVSRSVARVRILDSRGGLLGWGTGFMASPRLFLTNNHVLQSVEEAASSRVDFNYQDGLDGKPMPVAVFGLDPVTFFETDVDLDFTLVAVSAGSPTLAPLESFGFCPMIPIPAKTLVGEYLNIIQHPEGQPKQVAVRENRLLARLDNFLHYETDTAPGSSGSPVFNDQWEVVALHHSGVPATNEAGEYVTIEGKIWSLDQGEHKLAWTANEGTRISSICTHLVRLNATGPKGRLLSELLNHSPPIEVRAAAADRTRIDSEPVTPVATPDGSAIEIPLKITVQVDGADRLSSARASISTGAGRPTGTPLADPDDADLRDALEEARRARARPYYSKPEDERDRSAYYEGIDFEDPHLYRALNVLLEVTHTNPLRYNPSLHVYPWLDLQPNLKLKSVYSGIEFEPEDVIREDARIEQRRAAELARLMRVESSVGLEALQALEVSHPFNCEHVVPQSWFGKREPMRGDLHHLFACEWGCNSFRGNLPYFDFADFEEAIRTDCGKRLEHRFEPGDGKGVVARAVLYFVLRYPHEINATDAEYELDRLRTLVAWHKTFCGVPP